MRIFPTNSTCHWIPAAFFAMCLPLSIFFMPMSIYSQNNDNRIQRQVQEKLAAGEKANLLINEQSPYLLQHAFNPVQWYPWGKKVFMRAKDEDKPIFLSIGYSTCHWCHVMAHESFENKDIAALLNKWFISIKVDREERPDIDQMYMAATQAMTGAGGWPMSLFLLPDGSPFYAGTYFPPESSSQRIGLKDLLTTIHTAWTENRKEIHNIAAKMINVLQNRRTTSPSPIQPDVFKRGFKLLAHQYNQKTGGFGPAPKFPRPVIFSFLFSYYLSTGEIKAKEMALFTLRKMASGGVYDQIGGGFHRYSVDNNWFVPHFEKMLYDQAQLANSYLDGYQITADYRYGEIAEEIFTYVLRDMHDKAGGFYSAEDADSDNPYSPGHPSEGAYYLWEKSDIDSRLSPLQAKIFSFSYDVRKNGNVEHDLNMEFSGRNILHKTVSIEEAAAHFNMTTVQIAKSLNKSKNVLFQARRQRKRPHLDDKIITSWNGMMIGSLARGSRILHNQHLLASAIQTASFLRKNLYNSTTHTLQRRYRNLQPGLPGQLSDYTFLTDGLIKLYQANHDPQWLSWAVDLTSRQIQLFWNEEEGFFFDSISDPSVKLRMRSQYDSAEPAGNSVAALNLLRLGQLQNNPQWEKIAHRLMESFSTVINRYPPALPLMLTAWKQGGKKTTQVVIAGKRDADDTKALLDILDKNFDPGRLILLLDGGENQKYLTKKLPFLENMKRINNQATAYVCANFTCKLPVTDPEELQQQLTTLLPSFNQIELEK